MIQSREFEGEISYDEIYAYLQEQTNVDPEYPFSEYAKHEFRRLHITLQAFERPSVQVAHLILKSGGSVR